MSIQLIVAGLFVESVQAEIHQRRMGVRASVTIGVRDVQVNPNAAGGLANAPDADVASVSFTHYIDALDEEGKPFYGGAIRATAFLMEADGQALVSQPPQAILRQAIAVMMPVTALKLRESLSLMGLEPVPRIPHFVRLDQDE